MSSFIRRRSISRLAAGAAAIALIGPGLVTMMSGQAAAADQDPAAQVIQRTADELIRIKADASREAAIMRLLQAEFDLNYMGRSTLATHWDQATPEQRERFLKVQTSAEAHAYAKRFAAICRPEADRDRCQLRNGGQRPRIVDVKVGGVSMS